MTHSIRSSNASAPCRLEWRPSHWVIAALGVLGLLGAFSILCSEMPRLLAWPLALGSIAYGGWRARRESQRPPHDLVWPADGTPMIDGHVLREAQLQWRGSLAFLRWRGDGDQLHRLAWWPDTLSLRARRELRLAAAGCASTRPHASVAP